MILGEWVLQMIKAAMFDLDGTLLDRDESVKLFIEEQYNRFPQLKGYVTKNMYIKRFIELDNRGYVWKDKVYHQIANEFSLPEPSWEDLFADYINEFKNHCLPFPHLIEMLEDLKRNNFKLGIISNGFGQFQIDNINALGINEYFDVILISEWEGIKKPDPRIFNVALKQLQVSPNEAIFVGDHPKNDVKAAQDVGMKGIWKRDAHWEDVEADYIVDGLLEIPLVIQECNRLGEYHFSSGK